MDDVNDNSKKQLVGKQFYSMTKADDPKPKLVPLYPVLKEMNIYDLKGLNNCTIAFDAALTAIMGVNGSGKTTIIHALACCFKPDDRFKSRNIFGERKKFYEFFPPSPDASWKNSKFLLRYDLITEDGEVVKKDEQKEYSKTSDRWKPRYDRQPIKDTKYIGISTCIPDIETFKQSNVQYDTAILQDKKSLKILNDAAVILNKDYKNMTKNKSDKKVFDGVTTKSGKTYCSLSMGAGEQRIFRILEALHDAYPYSLILIDEIDLLMHSRALIELIKKMYEIAEEKKLQIVFTTHSLVMDQLKDYVSIKYLENIVGETKVYEGLTSLTWNSMTGKTNKPIKIFVEDDLSVCIIKNIAHAIQILKKVEICKFGAASNAFVLAASMVIRGENTNNVLIILDGDVYISVEEKLQRMKKVFSGDDDNCALKREKAVKLILQYHLPSNTKPEEFMHALLCNSSEEDEIIDTAKGINAVSDSHDWIDSIAYQIDEGSETVKQRIIDICAKSSEWSEYIKPIYDWLDQRKSI